MKPMQYPYLLLRGSSCSSDYFYKHRNKFAQILVTQKFLHRQPFLFKTLTDNSPFCVFKSIIVMGLSWDIDLVPSFHSDIIAIFVTSIILYVDIPVWQNELVLMGFWRYIFIKLKQT